MPQPTGNARLSQGRACSSSQVCGSSSSKIKLKKKGEPSISDTIKVLKQRGFNVTADGTTVKPWYMVDPRTSAHVAKWDATLAFVLCLTALVTPYEIAFMPPPLSADLVFWFNRVIDVIFLCDMVLVCFTITPIVSALEGTKWITRPPALFARYVRSGWFFIDLIALITSGFDVVALVSRDAGYLRRLKVLRVLRVLKLILWSMSLGMYKQRTPQRVPR